jgi:hypothetical protein
MDLAIIKSQEAKLIEKLIEQNGLNDGLHQEIVKIFI